MYQDKTLVCRDCKQEFVFSAGEQEFYATKGFQNEPLRCPACRAARRQNRGNAGRSRERYDIICAGCGQSAQVPFRPSQDRPVYCEECFLKMRR
jgi:CxxC-x17-CxxC domain-containing protein